MPTQIVGTIFASSRTESTTLKELVAKSNGRVVFVDLDVTKDESVEQAVTKVEKSLGGKGLDVLINNVGICQYAMNGVQSM